MPHSIPPSDRFPTGRWLPPWMPILLAAALGLLAACDRDAGSPAPAATAPVATVDDADPVEEDDAVTSALPPPSTEVGSSLTITNNSGAIRFDGRLDSQAHLDAVSGALEASYPEGQARGDLVVDPNTTPPTWIDGLGGFLAGFNVSGAGLRFDGDRIELTGKVDPDTRARLTDAARQHFPDARLGGLFIGDEDDPAMAALAALGADAPASELERTLNGITIDFEPDSARLSSSSLALLSRAGQAIAGMPRDRRVEIIGNASPSDDPGLDERLARQRAEAVKVQLIVNGVSPAQIATASHLGGDGPTATDSVGFRVAD